MQLLAISGSLRAASSNTVLLRAAAHLAPHGIEIRLYEQMGELPHFNPEHPIPEIVTELKQTVVEADGILFCTPEYVHGLPGSLKNLLDWLVSDGELWDKPVAVFSVRKSEFAEPQLREILRTLMVQLCEEASVLIPFSTNKMEVEEVLQKPELREPLEAALAVFATFVRESAKSAH